MKILSLRTMHATNSSSTHSIVMEPNKKRLKDKYCGSNFGWDNFRLVSKEAKVKYFCASLYSALIDIISEDYIPLVVKSFVPDFSLYDSNAQGVDHQSKINIPVKYTSWYKLGHLNTDYVNDLYNFLTRNDVIIYGGNDNAENNNPGSNVVLPIDVYGSLKGYKHNDVWTLYNRDTGAKIRFMFDHQDKEVLFDKAPFPELVDLKITDYCEHNCSYCYQSSSKNGQHAKCQDIQSIIYTLSQLGTFEVAIGGGDPIKHPDILNILKHCRDNDIVPNFSTRSVDWLSNIEYAKQVIGLVGSIAFSVYEKADIIKIINAHYSNILSENKFVIHHVCGSLSEYNFIKFIDQVKCFGLKVVFLGFKDNGLGKQYKEKKPDNFDYNIPLILHEKSLRYYGCDTSFVQKYKDTLEELGISPKLYYAEEGKYSMYINAVDQTIAKSSYDEETIYKYDKYLSKDIILKQFNLY